MPAISFRPLVDDDLPRMHRWLNEPGVVRWWEGDDVSWDGVVATHGAARDDRTEQYLALLDGAPVGWIQCYPVGEDPAEARSLWAAGVRRDAGLIDYLVGEPDARGRGSGSALIAAFVDEVVLAGHPGWSQVCAVPQVANLASRRALEKAGFRALAVVAGPVGNPLVGDAVVMVRDRAPAATQG